MLGVAGRRILRWGSLVWLPFGLACSEDASLPPVPSTSCIVETCNDGDPCTDDFCAPDGTCAHAENNAPCDDGDACTWGNHCIAGTCGEAITCDDDNSCTTDGCDSVVGCQYVPNANACDDHDACTNNDACEGGSCVGGLEVSCEDGNPCTDDSCDAQSGCVSVPNTAPCDDGDACTAEDVCTNSLCAGSARISCDDGDPCTDDGCDALGGCLSVPNNAPCDDGDACTTNDLCAAGVCVGEGSLPCDDGNLCTDDSCDVALGCLSVPNVVPCDDGSACTVGDVCAGGGCVPGAPPDCDDGNVCTNDACSAATGCVHPASAGPCTDGDACTADVCDAGQCVGAPAELVKVVAGYGHTCALMSSGALWCWGDNFWGELGDGTNVSNTSPAIVALDNVADVSVGAYTTCAVTDDGALYCWGSNYYGQLGTGTAADQSVPTLVTFPDGSGSGVVAVAVGGDHTCALRQDETLWCWGANGAGQLGNGTTSNFLVLAPSQGIGAPTGVVALVAGGAHTCALDAQGSLYCWGANFTGALGDGTTTNRLSPTSVAGLPVPAVEIKAGDQHTCARLTDGTAWCWGANYEGQLGVNERWDPPETEQPGRGSRSGWMM